MLEYSTLEEREPDEGPREGWQRCWFCLTVRLKYPEQYVVHSRGLINIWQMNE